MPDFAVEILIEVGYALAAGLLFGILWFLLAGPVTKAASRRGISSDDGEPVLRLIQDGQRIQAM
jgi:hypothetical protein